ncbi:hypothetical protein JOD43_000688 [Pullulanibacillus pueri]|uniref:Uncharacterized protein n=1 Tax=Pullulanibacillus pueri TaxID=1437324 RepID=A0A8J2ZYI9_9BACL|nr:hypothetical protein [Pullulanibacillus pueri]MBM7680526.1 hypothetical protein [Pullulanibacillus pueri]GGH86118.1 hypothetical protein GCM10007096_33080 [Pullulanibacillus pueri]
MLDKEEREARQKEFTLYLILFILLVIVGAIGYQNQTQRLSSPYDDHIYPAKGMGNFNPDPFVPFGYGGNAGSGYVPMQPLGYGYVEPARNGPMYPIAPYSWF